MASSSETLACFLDRGFSFTKTPLKYRHSPSNLEDIFEETRDNVFLTGFLIKVCDAFEVCAEFSLVGGSRERNINMFTRDPFIKVIFNLKDKSRYIQVLIPEIKAYHCQHKSDCNHSEYSILRKLGVNNTVIFFVLEPDFVDDGLDKGGTKYSGF